MYYLCIKVCVPVYKCVFLPISPPPLAHAPAPRALPVLPLLSTLLLVPSLLATPPVPFPSHPHRHRCLCWAHASSLATTRPPESDEPKHRAKKRGGVWDGSALLPRPRPSSVRLSFCRSRSHLSSFQPAARTCASFFVAYRTGHRCFKPRRQRRGREGTRTPSPLRKCQNVGLPGSPSQSVGQIFGRSRNDGHARDARWGSFIPKHQRLRRMAMHEYVI